ncbi:hypothetical protein ACFLR2_01135 [Chlamydiota bacterium]
MLRLFLILALLTSPLFAARFSADTSARSFESKEPRKQRVDVYDFDGEYPELENISINAKRKKNVELHLTGDYPVLELVNYEGSFGVLSGELTGKFPQLACVNFLCSSCAMNLDLSADWSRSCEINIRGADGDVELTLPKDVGLEIHTKVALKGKVLPCEGLKKKERLGILNKTYVNDLVETSPIVLKINIEVADGRIILN